MKKVVLMLAAAVLAISSIGIVSAEAAVYNYRAGEDGYFSIDYTNSSIVEDSYYCFVVVDGIGDTAVLDLSEDNMENILYIEQGTGLANGAISFSRVGLKDYPADQSQFAGATAYIGGKGFNTAQTIGTLGPYSNVVLVNLTGTIKDTVSGLNKLAAVTVLDGETEVATATATDGAFTIEVEEGTYSVKFAKAGYLNRTYTNAAVGAEGLAMGEIDMSGLAGDVVETGEINAFDLGDVLADFGKISESCSNANSDVNATGEVNAFDLAAVLGAFGRTNETVNLTD